MRNHTFVLGVLLFAAACSTTKQEALESVAKDWCATIRASQVMPVYPLTQDVQPGDVFLVQLPIERQQELWQQKGYLALDHHLARINPLGYRAFYARSFLRDGPATRAAVLPADWIARHPGIPESRPWALAPGAAFPTYSFSVRQSTGLGLALPISGIPIGLGFLGTNAADGSVSIADAHTLGVDESSLWKQVQAWAARERPLLAAYGQPDDQPQAFVRVVTRVYVTGSLHVSLFDAQTRAFGADVGVAPSLTDAMASPASRPAEDPSVAVNNYSKGLAAVNAQLAASRPAGAGAGGAIRVASASSRSIVLEQDFDPPLVIGYLGFDCAIGLGGELRAPIPSLARLENAPSAFAILHVGTRDEVVTELYLSALYDVVEAASREPTASVEARAKAQQIATMFDHLDADVKADLPKYDQGPSGAEPGAWRLPAAGFARFTVWRAGLKVSVDALERVAAGTLAPHGFSRETAAADLLRLHQALRAADAVLDAAGQEIRRAAAAFIE